MFSDNKLEDLKQKAIKVLSLNHQKNFTKPSSKLYPHQWNWDSAFIAIGLSHIDEESAQNEIYSLLRGQWINGMIPHIVYSDNPDKYIPNANFWGSRHIDGSPNKINTSGITQPPVLSFAALKVYENSKDKKNAKKFLKDIYPNLVSYHRFLHEDRDLTGEGLICVLHPWESGLDNSPRWDNILRNDKDVSFKEFSRIDNQLISKHQRPSDKDYKLYFQIAEKLKVRDYKINDYSNLPFVVQDILFNSLALVSLESLIKISDLLQMESQMLIKWYHKLSKAIVTKLWVVEKNQFCDWDVISSQVIDKLTIANCIPLILNSLKKEQVDSILKLLNRNGEFWYENSSPLSSTSLSSPEFNSQNYWRGPVWINMNWLIIQGLLIHKRDELANDLAFETICLVSENGFYEYFDPFTGLGCGSENFSWTAALIIDIIVYLQQKPGSIS